MKSNSSRLRFLCTSLAMLLLSAYLFACDGESDVPKESESASSSPTDSISQAESESEPTSNSGETEADSESETSPAQTEKPPMIDTDPEIITLFREQATDYCLIKPADISGNTYQYIVAFQKKLKTFSPSLIVMNERATPRAREILIGRCNRAESIALYEEIDASARPCYRIRVVDRKIVIGATDSAMLGLAIDVFCAQYLEEDVSATVQIPTDWNASGQGSNYALSDRIDALGNNIVGQATLVGTIPADPIHQVHQGACTDGRYMYLVLEDQTNGTSGDHCSIILKLDPETLEVVMKSEPLAIDHGNDISYNSKTNELIVSHNAPNRKYLSIVDPDTLTLKSTLRDNKYQMYGIDYNETYNRYVIGISNGYSYCILDENFNPVCNTMEGVTGYTKQGMICDDRYIYFLQYKTNCITVNDWNGNQIMTIALEGITREPEGIFYLNDTLYVTSYEGKGNPTKIWTIELAKAGA